MADSVAEMFFLIAVDGLGGRPRTRTDLLYSGVVGGVLADLALRQLIRVDDDGLVRPTSAASVGDVGDAAAHVLEAVAAQEGTRAVRRWIEDLGPAVFELVYQRLADTAVLRRERTAGLRRHEVYPPVHLVAAATPRLELARMLRDPRRFTLLAGVFAVLVDVTGLSGTFGADRHKSIVREIMGELADGLPGDLRAITSGVRAAAAHRAVLPQ
jgi:Golgi phosphoprotein 3 (GPP34)